MTLVPPLVIVDKFLGRTPWETMSAGFDEEATWCHLQLFVNSCISLTWFATKVFHVDGHLLSQATTTLESVNKWISPNWISRLVITLTIRRANKTTPYNTRRGNEICLSGATLDLAQINLTIIWPLGLHDLKYTHTLYAISEASEKPCSCALIWFLITTSLSILILSRSLREL